MTECTKNGGAAFPHSVGPMDDRAGMSLRDWFAGQALAAIISKHGPLGKPLSPDTGRKEVTIAEAGRIQRAIARGAYEYADAMIAERGQ